MAITLLVVCVIWFAVECWDRWYTVEYNLFQSEEEPQEDSYEDMRAGYIEETIEKHSIVEVEHMIWHMEQALLHPHNEIEYDVYRENLDLLNTIYVEMLMRETENKFRALQNSQIS